MEKNFLLLQLHFLLVQLQRFSFFINEAPWLKFYVTFFQDVLFEEIKNSVFVKQKVNFFP